MFIPYAVDVPMKRLPWANWGLILFTVAMSIAVWFGAFGEPREEKQVVPQPDELQEIKHDPERIRKLVESVKKRKEPPALALRPDSFSPDQLVTSLLAHQNVIHLVMNMFFLFAFGNAVNAKLGHWVFLGSYWSAGILAGLAWLLVGDGRPVVGASGAIMGVVGLFLVLFPRNEVLIWALYASSGASYAGTIYIPSYMLIVTYFLSDLLGALFVQHGGVAYICHVVGAWLGVTVGLILVLTRWVKPTRYEENLLQTFGLMPKRLQFEDVYWEERERMWEEKKRRRRRKRRAEPEA